MRKRLLATVLLSLFVPFFALAANSESFSIAPSRGTSSWLLYEIKPGESMADNVIVRNLGTEVQTFSLVALDAQKKAGDTSDSFLLTGRESTQQSIGKWTTISQPTVTLQPGENKSVPFTVLVPTTTPKEVEYTGAIVVTPVADSTTTQKGGKSVSVATEVALRMYVKVTDNPKLTATTKPAPVEVSAEEAKEEDESDSEESSSTRNILIGAAAVVVIAGLGYAFMRKQ